MFNPYSGVKTSILILDRAVAKASKHVAFFKIENDGFALGAQRKAVKGSQLAQVKAELGAWLQAARAGGGEALESDIASSVERTKLAADGDFNLSVERYQEKALVHRAWPMVALGELTKRLSGGTPSKAKEEFWNGDIPWVSPKDMKVDLIADTEDHVSKEAVENSATSLVPAGTVLCVVRSGILQHTFPVALTARDMCFNQDLIALIADEEKLLGRFLFWSLKARGKEILADGIKPGVTVQSFHSGFFQKFEIPLPPLEVQREIVAEVEGYQRVIDGARAVLDNYRPHIPVDPEWPVRTLDEVARINPDSLNPEREFPGGQINYFDIASIENHSGRILEPTLVSVADAPSRARRRIEPDDLLISTVRPNLKAFGIVRSVPDNAVASTGFAVVRAVEGLSDPFFLLQSIRSDASLSQLTARMEKGSYPSVNQADMAALKLPMPPIGVQRAIAAEIEAEQALVNGNRELIARFEKKIDAAIARVWGEAKGESEA